MKAHRKHLEKYSERTRSISDRRKFVAVAIFSYISETGYEYRKRFTLDQNSSEASFWNVAPLTIDVEQ